MTRILRLGALGLPALLFLAACEDTTGPQFGPEQEVEELATMEAVEGEVSVSVDIELASAMMADMKAAIEDGTGQSVDLSEAEAAFSAASASFSQGNETGARAHAARGRLLLGKGYAARRGAKGVEELFLRIKAARASLEDSDNGNYVRIQRTLDRLLDRAAKARQRGQMDRAVADLVLGGQIVDGAFVASDRDGDRHAGRARFVVLRAKQAVALASRLLGDSATDSQNRLLARAVELAHNAQVALGEGAFRRAFALGRRAEATALFSVLDSDRLSSEEVRTIHELAETLLREVTEISDPTQFQQRLTLLAEKQLRIGERLLNAGVVRGVSLLWRSAVTSSVALNAPAGDAPAGP